MMLHKAPFQPIGIGVTAPKRVILNADCDTFAALGRTDYVRLRLFCEEGSSVLLTLRNPDHPPGGWNPIKVVTLTVTKDQLLDSLEGGLEVVFYDKGRDRAVSFQATGISKDAWFGDILPHCEPRN